MGFRVYGSLGFTSWGFRASSVVLKWHRGVKAGAYGASGAPQQCFKLKRFT